MKEALSAERHVMRRDWQVPGRGPRGFAASVQRDRGGAPRPEVTRRELARLAADHRTPMEVQQLNVR